jgi:thiamine biosynthesis lipoprotein
MIRRARPLLGTIVCISADAASAEVEAAFAAIERVHALMNFHSDVSDVARISGDGHRKSVRVDRWTFEVLRQAIHISEQSEGAFDVVLPGKGASYTDIILESDCRVRLRRAADIDLGGIAKGFAVDVAVNILEAAGVKAGSVNAGGDLRFFGGWEGKIRVRVPGAPATAVCLPPAPQRAFATSAAYFGARLTDPRSGRPTGLDWSVTVAAATCLVADALTKAVALLGPLASLLKTFDASAFAVDANGRLHAAAAG